MRISDWSSDVCSSDLRHHAGEERGVAARVAAAAGDARGAGLAGDVVAQDRRVLGGAAGFGHRLHHRHHFVRDLRVRSEEHTSELQSLMRISYAVFCLKKKQINSTHT